MTATSVTPSIRRAEPGDTDRVADLLAEAFLYGDLVPMLVPHIDTRARIYRDYFAIHTAHALTAGWIDVVSHPSPGDDGAGTVDGVAIWFEVKDNPAVELAITDYETRLAEVCDPYTPRFVALEQAMTAHHPRGVGHHYLALLAVHPDRQNRGIGTALLEHHHDILDTASVPAYLEATGHRNSRLYLRHRYRRQRPFLVADGTKLYPMWRNPAPGPKTQL